MTSLICDTSSNYWAVMTWAWIISWRMPCDYLRHFKTLFWQFHAPSEFINKYWQKYNSVTLFIFPVVEVQCHWDIYSKVINTKVLLTVRLEMQTFLKTYSQHLCSLQHRVTSHSEILNAPSFVLFCAIILYHFPYPSTHIVL